MAVEIENPNFVVFNGDVRTNKKSKEISKRRRKQKKNKKQNNNSDDNAKENSDPHQEKTEIEYVMENLEFGDAYAELKSVIEKFNAKNAADAEDDDENMDEEEKKVTEKQDDEEEEQDANQNDNGEVSNKKKKLQRRMKIAELKQLCARPDLVEVWDTTAANPKLLVFLKSYRNTVPVPRHWCQKRKFLQGKRGIEKQPFQLPDFIAATGIEKIRQAYIEKEDSKKMKQKQRDRMKPKMGYMGIDYQVLHDAFFKYQTKPKLTGHGELYHEGKEFEQVKLREMKKPGMLSQELKEALGMQECARFINNMQRYGPPPSYPHLKIPGLNELYGDVVGVQQQEQLSYEEEPVDRSKHWGDLEDEVEIDEDEVDIQEEDLEDNSESIGGDNFSSTPTGVETPDVIELRKPPRQLYQVIEQKEAKIAPGTLLGTTHTYVVGASSKRVDVNILPEELEGLENQNGILAAKYEKAREEEKQRSQREDFSDMVADNEKKRKRKMHEKDGKSSKKKDFKF
ncbi:hypothetical protein MKX03_006375 [Papaver bracteatum]|nr:hypothetical protein MKX03_006375 [Papaver bracteatum]